MKFRPKLRQNWIKALLLSLFAVGLNLLKIDLLFDFELLLGSSLAILALLLLGNLGLVVGLSASLMVWKICGNPWCGMSSMVELLWLWAYLNYFSHKEESRSDGRIIIADILFWIVIGIPAAFLFIGVFNNLDPAKVLLLVSRQALNGSISTTIGFSLYLLIRMARAPDDRSQAIPIHGLTFAVVMMSVMLPSLALASISSNQLVQASLLGKAEQLYMIAKEIATATIVGAPKIADSLRNRDGLVEFERSYGSERSQHFESNPELFKALSQTHAPDIDRALQLKGMQLLTSKHPAPNMNRRLNSYWRLDLAQASMGEDSLLDAADGRPDVIVVEPAKALLLQLQTQSSRTIGMLSWCMTLAILASEMLARLVAKQFNLDDLQISAQPESPTNPNKRKLQKQNLSPPWQLKVGKIRELNQMITLLNERQSQINRLKADLQSASLRLKSSRAEIDVLTTVDPLTGCFNQHELYRRLDFELQRSNRDRSDLSCLCIEVDHLSQIRNSYGATMADQVLIEVGAEIQARARTTDCLCRSGDTEFSLVLPMCSGKAAEGLAQEFHHAIKTRVVKHEDQQISVTISIGISCLRRGNDDSESLIHRAQNALYRAKIEGRNRSVTG